MSEPLAQYGIIGYPLEHSLSPLMHNAAFKELKVKAIYKTFPLQEDELGIFFKDLREKNNPMFGLNVTVPYKEKVLAFMDEFSPFAEKAGAVNTIVITGERKFIGHNTDGPGFLAHLAELKVETNDQRIAILGAGGSARAILTALSLISERPQSIKIYNRTESKLEYLMEDLQKRVSMDMIEPVTRIEDLNIELADILINTTSIGMKKGEPCLVDEDLFHRDLFVYDLIYNPKETVLLKLAKGKGAKVSNGLGMLYYQGVLSLQHWLNHQINDKIKIKMRESLEHAL